MTPCQRHIWPALMRFKRSETDPLPAAFTEGYAKAGIDVIKGRARFVGPSALAVNGDRVTGRHVLIAAGARRRHSAAATLVRAGSRADYRAVGLVPGATRFSGSSAPPFQALQAQA